MNILIAGVSKVDHLVGAEAECYDNWMRPALVWVWDYQDIQYSMYNFLIFIIEERKKAKNAWKINNMTLYVHKKKMSMYILKNAP